MDQSQLHYMSPVSQAPGRTSSPPPAYQPSPYQSPTTDVHYQHQQQESLTQIPPRNSISPSTSINLNEDDEVYQHFQSGGDEQRFRSLAEVSQDSYSNMIAQDDYQPSSLQSDVSFHLSNDTSHRIETPHIDPYHDQRTRRPNVVDPYQRTHSRASSVAGDPFQRTHTPSIAGDSYQRVHTPSISDGYQHRIHTPIPSHSPHPQLQAQYPNQPYPGFPAPQSAFFHGPQAAPAYQQGYYPPPGSNPYYPPNSSAGYYPPNHAPTQNGYGSPNSSFPQPNVPYNSPPHYGYGYEQNYVEPPVSSSTAYPAPGGYGSYPYGASLADQRMLRMIEHQRLTQYYADYYKRWYQSQLAGALQPTSRQRLTPQKFVSLHSHAAFGGKNQLITLNGNKVVIYQLEITVLESTKDAQRYSLSSWPGPLDTNETTPGDVLEWLKSLQGQIDFSHEIKMIVYLLLTLVKQNGVLNGADLAEVIVSHLIDAEENEENSDGVALLRRLLMQGQRKRALEVASRSSLWDHSLALTYLLTPPSKSQPSMVSIINKWMSTTLSREDPLFVLYRRLLQQSSPQGVLVPANNLEQFAILLANECHVDFIESNYPQLIKLMVAIRNGIYDHIIETGEDMLFINEVWEYARNSQEAIPFLIPYKAIFAATLFDFGLINQALKYCAVIKRDQYSCSANWELIMRIVYEIETRCGDLKIEEYSPSPEFSEQTTISQQETPQHSNSYQPESQNITPQSLSQDLSELSLTHKVTRAIAEQPSNLQTTKIAQNVHNESPIKTKQNIQNIQIIQESSLNENMTNDVQSQSQPLVSKQITSSIPPPPTTQIPKSTGSWRRNRNVSLSAVSNASEASNKSPPAEPQVQPQFNFFVPAPVPSTNDEQPLSFVSTAPPSSFFLPGSVSNVDERDASEGQNNNVYNNTLNSNVPPQSQQFRDQESLDNSVDNLTRSRSESNPNNNNTKKGDQSLQQPEGKSMFSSVFSKLLPAKPKQAILPDDTKPTIIYDEVKKQWIDTSADPSTQDNSMLNGPPKMSVPSNGAPQFQFNKSARKARYVDVFNQK